MKSGWEIKPLGELCEFQRGLTYAKSDEVAESNVVVLRANNLDLETNTLDFTDLRYIANTIDVPNEKRIKKGSLLICTASGSKSHLGKVAFIDNEYDYAFGGFMGQITPKPEMEGRYLFHVMTSPAYKDFIAALSDGANINNLKFNDLRNFQVAVPSIAEQRRIVTLLDEAFADIATAKANAEKNLQNARALFVSHLQSSYQQQCEGWTEARIADIAKHSLGKMLDKAKNRGDLKPYLRNLNVRWFDFDLSDVQEMKFTPEESDKYTAIKGDVLICEGGYPGRCAIWEDDEPIYFQKALHRVRFHNPLHNKWFVNYLYLMDQTGDLKNQFSGTGIQHFTGEALAKFTLPIPPDKQIQQLLHMANQLEAEVVRLESLYRQKLTALDDLKKSLLHQAFSGQL